MSSPPRNSWPLVLPWVVAGVALFLVAALAGVGAAYIVTTANAVPTVDPALLPTPTPKLTATAAVASPTSGSSSPTPTVSLSPAPTPSPPIPPTPTATETTAPGPTPTPISYVVKRGDRLSAIADQFGVSVDAIVALNHLKNPDHIEVGQVLLIPVP